MRKKAGLNKGEVGTGGNALARLGPKTATKVPVPGIQDPKVLTWDIKVCLS